MKYWWLILVLVISGCCTQKRCLTKYPPVTRIEVHDTIIYRDTIIYHDRTVYDTIEADTQFVEVPVPINIPMPSDTARVENTYAIAKAWLESRSLKLQLEQKQQVIEKILRNAEVERNYWRELYQKKNVVITNTVYKTKKIHKATMWFSGSIIFLFILWLVNKFKKFLPFI